MLARLISNSSPGDLPAWPPKVVVFTGVNHHAQLSGAFTASPVVGSFKKILKLKYLKNILANILITYFY